MNAMTRGADDPEELMDDGEPDAGESESEETAEAGRESVETASFDDVLLSHMTRCWDAQLDIAERLTKKVTLIVSVLALLFGLGLFKIEWTYDPKELPRVHPIELLWAMKVALAVALICFGMGLFRGLTGIKRPFRQFEGAERELMASDLLPLTKDEVLHPPKTEEETRAIVFYKLSEAIDELKQQNQAKAEKVKLCEMWFLCGLGLVLLAMVTYILFSFPPVREDLRWGPRVETVSHRPG